MRYLENHDRDVEKATEATSKHMKRPIFHGYHPYISTDININTTNIAPCTAEYVGYCRPAYFYAETSQLYQVLPLVSKN